MSDNAHKDRPAAAIASVKRFRRRWLLHLRGLQGIDFAEQAEEEHLVLEPPLMGVTQDPRNHDVAKIDRAPIMGIARPSISSRRRNDEPYTSAAAPHHVQRFRLSVCSSLSDATGMAMRHSEPFQVICFGYGPPVIRTPKSFRSEMK